MRADRKTKRRWAWTLIGLLSTAIPAAAQQTVICGEIKGRIRDHESQKPVAGVRVSIVDAGREVRSDANGAYILPEVQVLSM